MSIDLEARLRRAGTQLDESFERGETTPYAVVTDPGSHGRPSRRILAGVAAALLLGASALAVSGRVHDPVGLVPAAGAPSGPPRLLLDGFDVARADEYGEGEGEMTFTAGAQSFDLHWSTGELDERVKDRADSSDLDETVTAGGVERRVFRYAGTTDYTALWASGDRTFELRGVAASEEQFTALLGSLRPATEAEWEAAIDGVSVTPGELPSEVARILAPLPVPDGFDPASIDVTGAAHDPYQLGARVVGAVACAWFAIGGDGAAQALSTARTWPILQEMDAQGDYPEVLWSFTDRVAAGETVTLADVSSALGC